MEPLSGRGRGGPCGGVGKWAFILCNGAANGGVQLKHVNWEDKFRVVQKWQHQNVTLEYCQLARRHELYLIEKHTGARAGFLEFDRFAQKVHLEFVDIRFGSPGRLLPSVHRRQNISSGDSTHLSHCSKPLGPCNPSRSS